MKILKLFSPFILVFAVTQTGYAKDFNSGSLEFTGESSFSHTKYSYDQSDTKRTILNGTALYYAIKNLAVGVNFTQGKLEISGPGGSSSSKISAWSPVIAYNISVNQNSAVLFGATKIGLIRGESTSESTGGFTTTDKYEGHNLFIMFRHYINDYAGFSAGISSTKVTTTPDFGSSSDETDNVLSFGIVLSIPN